MNWDGLGLLILLLVINVYKSFKFYEKKGMFAKKIPLFSICDRKNILWLWLVWHMNVCVCVCVKSPILRDTGTSNTQAEDDEIKHAPFITVNYRYSETSSDFIRYIYNMYNINHKHKNGEWQTQNRKWQTHNTKKQQKTVIPMTSLMN